MRSLRTNHWLAFRLVWGNLRHADWEGAQHRFGPLGLIVEFFRALSGFSAWPFFIPADAGWEPEGVRNVLAQYRIANWGWGYHAGEYFFQAPMRQAHWAQYLLQQAGVPIGGQLLASEGRGKVRPAPAAAPWGQAGTAAAVRATRPAAQPVRSRSPLGRIDALVDRLADW